ncbi:MAG: DUF6398 domain-containing protein [Bacillota bacterium]
MATKDAQVISEKKQQLIDLTKGFCNQFLDEEYELVIQKLINKMVRKRNVPFLSGKVEIWSAAIVHAMGTVNFLFDKSTKPNASVGDICDYFKTNQSTMVQKSKLIRDMFKMTYFDPEFSTARIAKDNPLNDLVLIDGLIIPKDRLK